jgi:adenylate cyclase
MTFLKQVWAFMSRWGGLTGPIFIFLACIGLIFLAGINRTVGHEKGFWSLARIPQVFEDKFYDYRVEAQIEENRLDPDITIVKLDDMTLSKIGTWPIPRKYHSKLLRQLKHFGAKVITLDILFPENSQDLAQDHDFASAIQEFRKGGGEVVLPYSLTELDPKVYSGDKGDALAVTPDFVYMQSGNAQLNEQTKAFWINRHTFPIEELVKTEALMGHIGNQEDHDGVFRHYRIIANYIDESRSSVYVASMGLAAAEAFSGEKAKIFTSTNGQAVLNFKGKDIKIDEWGEIKVRYSATGTNYPSLTYYNVLTAKPNDPAMEKALRGRLVMVGSTAEGAHDLRNSPIDPKMPGMYTHTNVAHQLLHGYVYEPEDKSFTVSLLMMFLGFLVIVVVQRWGNAIVDIVTLLAVSGTVVALDSELFLPQGYELRLFYCLLCFFGTYSWSTFINFWRSAKEKKQIKGTFARYVSPAIVNEMLDHPDKLKVGGEKRDITCLFSDVRDFTSISEKLTATELSGMLNQYMGQMTDIVFETKGTLDKYIGDAIVAFWGAPLDLPNHPEHAVEGAVKMMELLPAINADFLTRGLPEFKVGIGLNSGECSVGNMGSNKIFSYTALGDNMNLGARLEGLCKYYGVQILISEYTHARLSPEKFRFRAIDRVKVKGKTHPVKIYEVIHGAHPLAADREAFDFYNSAYDSFMEKNFAKAKTLLEGILLAHPDDKPTARLLKLCERWQQEAVPEDFDVTTMTEK